MRCFGSVVTDPQDQIQYFGRKRQTNVSLRALLDTGNGSLVDKDGFAAAPAGATATEKVLIQVACFLHRELPVRLAHRACELEGTDLFKNSKSIMGVCNWYKTSFQELRTCPAPVNMEKEAIFSKTIESIYERHSATLITMAKGAHEIRSVLQQDVASFAEHQQVQKKLDDFYMSRIGIRMLIGQYLALRKPQGDPNMVGLISTRASPFDIAQQAIADAAYMCTRTHGDAPEVTIHGRTDLTFPYVSSHISYILLELLKNSMRATVETHGVDKMPRIRVIIADGEDNEDVVIKVSDEGGGIKRSNMNRIWSYLYTTADPAVLDRLLGSSSNVDGSDSDGVQDTDAASPLAGLGYGLPLSRNYARYFGGELTIMSMEGYGTDGSLYLPRLKVKKTV